MDVDFSLQLKHIKDIGIFKRFTFTIFSLFSKKVMAMTDSHDQKWLRHQKIIFRDYWSILTAYQ